MLPHAQVGFGEFLTVFSAAMLLGMIGHTPGGVGVFEAAMVFALGGSVKTPEMLAALLAYRAIYFGLPLIAADIRAGSVRRPRAQGALRVSESIECVAARAACS